MPYILTSSKEAGRGAFPGLRLWRREKRALMRRWKRAMLLPETVLLLALILGGSYVSDHFRVGAGPQQALAAANGVIQDGVPSMGAKRKQRALQDRLRAAPQDLMKLTAADMVDAFGYADLNRQDGDASTLQFRGENCILDVFLNGGQPAHYEFRARVVAAANVDDTVRARSCINDILKSRRT